MRCMLIDAIIANRSSSSKSFCYHFYLYIHWYRMRWSKENAFSQRMGKKQSKKEYYGLESGNEVFGIEMHAWHVWTYLFHDTIEMKYYKNSFALSLSLFHSSHSIPSIQQLPYCWNLFATKNFSDTIYIYINHKFSKCALALIAGAKNSDIKLLTKCANLRVQYMSSVNMRTSTRTQ